MNNKQQNIAALLFYAVAITVVALVSGCNQKDNAIVIDDTMVQASMGDSAPIDTVAWENSIYNDENIPFIIEVAFNLEIEPLDVTQEQFNDRYMREQ